LYARHWRERETGLPFRGGPPLDDTASPRRSLRLPINGNACSVNDRFPIIISATRHSVHGQNQSFWRHRRGTPTSFANPPSRYLAPDGIAWVTSMRIARASRFFHANMFEPKRKPAQREKMPAAPFPAVAPMCITGVYPRRARPSKIKGFSKSPFWVGLLAPQPTRARFLQSRKGISGPLSPCTARYSPPLRRSVPTIQSIFDQNCWNG